MSLNRRPKTKKKRSHKSVFISASFYVKLLIVAQTSRILKRYPNLRFPYEDVLERKMSELELLKFAFNAENLISRLSWSIFSHSKAIHF